MKKFAKVSLITAGILLVIGCFLGSVSVIASGRAFGKNDYNDYPKDRVEASGQITASEIRNMKLELGAGAFTIKEEDTDEIEIFVSGKRAERCNYYFKGDTLYIESTEGLKDLDWIKLNDSYIEVEVRVPAGSSFEKIEVETGASIVKISDIKVDKLEAELGAGELYLNDMELTKLSVEVGAGRMEASDIWTCDAELEAGMGECIYSGAITGNLEADCGMGNMKFTLEGSETDHNYEIECSAGNIDLGSISISGLSVEKRINNNAASKFDIECSMGNVSISFKDTYVQEKNEKEGKEK